jgi:hypothetical protein
MIGHAMRLDDVPAWSAFSLTGIAHDRQGRQTASQCRQVRVRPTRRSACIIVTQPARGNRALLPDIGMPASAGSTVADAAGFALRWMT